MGNNGNVSFAIFRHTYNSFHEHLIISEVFVRTYSTYINFSVLVLMYLRLFKMLNHPTSLFDSFAHGWKNFKYTEVFLMPFYCFYDIENIGCVYNNALS